MVDNIFFFSDAQTLAGGAHDGTNVADLTGGTDGKDAFGNSIKIPPAAGKLFFNVRVTTVVAAGICAISLYTHTSAASVKSGTEIVSLIVPSAAAVGSCFSVGLAPGSAVWLRYINAVIDARANSCTGNVDVWLDTAPCTQNKLPR